MTQREQFVANMARLIDRKAAEEDKSVPRYVAEAIARSAGNVDAIELFIEATLGTPSRPLARRAAKGGA